MDEKPIDFTVVGDEPMEEQPMDLSPTDKSTHEPRPIDLTTMKRENAVLEDPPNRPLVSPIHMSDAQKTFNIYSGGIRIDAESRPLYFPHSYDSKPRSVPGSISPPIDTVSNDIDDLGVRLGSPTTSLTPPPITQAPTSPSHPGIQSTSPDLDSLMEKEGPNKRYMSASRLFNVLAKKLLGDIDCPPRPGQRQGSNASCGGTSKREDNESDAAYRERRSKNNLAARRSRDKRKNKHVRMATWTAWCKQESLEIADDIGKMQETLLNRGYTQPLPYQNEIEFIRNGLNMYS